jgi:LPPG:FO 2-phospho-L-lactate transferase
VLAAIAGADVVIIGPSNPYVSIDPILGLDGVLTALAHKRVIAVSPIVGGQAVKGPLAAMIEGLAGRAPSAAVIADHYGSLVTGLVVERGDEDAVKASRPALPVRATATVMHDRDDRERLAAEVLAFAEELA